MNPVILGLTVLGLLFTVQSFADNHEADEGQVFAKRGEGVVTHEMFDSRVLRIPEEHRLGVIRDRARLEDLLSNMLLNAQLATAARTAGLDRVPEVLARMNLAAEEELASAWIDNYVSQQPDADYEAMALEYFQVHPDQFKTELTIDVSHILIGTETRTEEEARALADSLYQQIMQAPNRFDALIREHSDDPGVSANAGLYTNVKKGQMVKSFEEAAFALQPGEISEPVRTPYGFHIIRLNDINEPRSKSFEEARPGLVARMRKQYRDRIRKEYLSGLAAQQTEMSQEALEFMVRRYFPDQAMTTDGPVSASE